MTINDIKEKQFDTSKRGYDPEEVDSFLREISTYIQSMQNEKSDLLKKMEILAAKVEDYRKDEESIQEALLGAQKLGKSVLNSAKEKAAAITKESEEKSEQMVAMARAESEKLLNDARAVAQELLVKAKAESKRLVAEAQQNVDTVIRNTKYDIEKEQHNLVRVQREVSAFKSGLLDLYRKHIDLIKNLPEVENEESNTREVRELNKKIYEQKPVETTQRVVNTQTVAKESKPAPQPKPQPAPASNTQATIEFRKNAAAPAPAAAPVNTPKAPAAQEGRELTEKEKQIVEKAKRDVLTDTVEIAKEHYVKKFTDLKFGAKSSK